MAKKIFLSDLDISLNQLLQAKLENLTTAQEPAGAGSESRLYYNTTVKKIKYYNGTEWLTVIDDLDSRLTNARTPTSHVIATGTGLGAEHTISGAAVGMVLRATGATAANFQLLSHSDLTAASIGTNTHSQIDTHIGTANIHAVLNDSSTLTTEIFSASKVLALISAVNDSIVGALIFKGGYDAATNTPALDATPIAVKQGWTYVVTVAGTFFTENVQPGDMMVSKQDSPTTLAHWTLVNKNIPDIVQASTTAQGIIELATAAEVNALTDLDRAVTPGTLPITSTSQKGLSQVATSAESITGTDALKAITPATLVARTSTETRVGLIEIATSAEVTTATDDTRAITPLKLAQVLTASGNGSFTRKFTTTVGNGTLTSIVVSHGITTPVQYQIYRTATPFDYVETEVLASSGSLTLNFNVAPTTNQYTVVVIG